MKIRCNKLYEMLLSAANLLEAEKEQINGLNVFPVPDGDTGSNMSMTMSGVKGYTPAPGDGAGDCAGKAAGKMLRSARGNSGVILSLFFKGFAKSLAYLSEIDTGDLTAAFREGCDCAYHSVMNPTEGTILTVMRRCAEKAEGCGDSYEGNPTGLFRELLEEAKAALAETPELLPVLKSAGVVDAGGRGFVSVLSGMLASLEGVPVRGPVADADEAQRGAGREKADFSSFESENITFPYCTECIVDKKEALRGEGTADELRKFVVSVGDSVVFVDDEEIIKIHVHTDDPGRVLSKALEFGALATVKVENMRIQHTELKDADLGGGQAQISEKENPVEKKPYGFVCVAAGKGIADTFRDLGADALIEGGQTMNPSMEDILSAIERTPADVLYVLPNNSNIYMAAQQAAKSVNDKTVYVLPSKSIPQGISAMLAFDETKGSDTNFGEMRDAMGNVCSLSVTYAAHDSDFEGKTIHTGEILGLVDGKVKYVTSGREDCIREMQPHFDGASYITIFYGEGAEEEEATRIEALVRSFAPNAEVMLLEGGQPVYSYLISVE